MNINKIKLSGTTYSIQDENATKTVELTQAQYDALSVKDPNTFYIITDATAGDLSNYYTKSETSGATEISTALASKADTATTYTKTEVDNAITAATSTKQDALVSGTNIKTINNESILGSGNITIEGGGKAVSAGTNISITTGETADTINCTLPITISDSANGSKQSIAIGSGSSAHISNYYDSIAIGKNSKGYFGSVVIGSNPTAYATNNGLNVAIGNGTKFYDNSVVIGAYAEGYNGYNANSVAIGTSARATNMKNAVAIGDNVSTTGTTKTNINNQLKIDTSNQVYIYNKDNTEMICLQDQLGGGGSSYTAGDGIDITNDVISVTGKVDTTTYETYTAATDTALASKQTTLTAGTGISIVDNVISATGGTSITIDPSLDSGSTNPVANSAITDAITANQNAVLITSENRNSVVEHIENDIYELKTNDIYSISFIPKDLEYTKFSFTCYVNGNYTDVTANKNVDTATTQISITFDSETNRITVTSLDRDTNKIDVFALRFKKTYYEDLEISDVYITHNPSLGVVKTEYEKTIQTSYKESGGYITERKGSTEIKYNYETTSTSNLVNGNAVNAAIDKVKTRFDGFGQSYKGGKGCTDYASQSPNITDFTSGEHSVTLTNTQSARVWWFNVKLNEKSTDKFGDLNINFSADGTSFGNLTLFLQMNTLEFKVDDFIKRIDVTDKTQTYSVFVPNGFLDNTTTKNVVASYNVWSMTEGEPFFLESIGIFDIPQDSSCLESFDEWKSNVDTDISNLSARTDNTVDMTHNHINDSSVHVTSDEKSTWDAKQDALVSGTNIKTINNESILGSGNITIEGGGRMTEDDELLLSTALVDLNDRKIDASEVKSNYQRKGDYATKDYVATALEPYETKLDEINTEEVTAYALNDLNSRFGGLSLTKITESEYAALTTKDENTLYIVVADPQTR